MALTICNSICRKCFRLMTDWKLDNLPIGEEISLPNGTASGGRGGGLQFPNGFSGKLLLHLTLNRNLRTFWLNGKHLSLACQNVSR